MAGVHTLVSVNRDGSHDSRAYANERAAVHMARWLARLRRYRSHVLVGPDGAAVQLGPDGERTSNPPSRPVQAGLDFTQVEARIATWLGEQAERREGPALPETYGAPGFIGDKRQAD